MGKTSLTLRFVKNEFDKQQDSTIDASFLDKKVTVGEKQVKLNIWDTAGQEKYHALAKNYYQGASGAVLVYDVTDMDSFEKAKTWFVELQKYIGKKPIILAGNKSDIIDKTVEVDMAEAYARSVQIEHVATSALSGHNVNYIFQTLAEKMVEQRMSENAGAAAAGGAKRKVNARGRIQLEGVEDFDPKAKNIQLGDRSSVKKKAGDKKDKKGCC